MSDVSSQCLSRKALANVLLHIECRIRQRITLDELAKIARLGSSHFSRLFHASVGEGPIHYVRRARIERAKRLIERGGMTLSEIALDAGFCDQSHLCRTFRDMTGQTPREYLHLCSLSGETIASLPQHAQNALANAARDGSDKKRISSQETRFHQRMVSLNAVTVSE